MAARMIQYIRLPITDRQRRSLHGIRGTVNCTCSNGRAELAPTSTNEKTIVGTAIRRPFSSVFTLYMRTANYMVSGLRLIVRVPMGERNSPLHQPTKKRSKGTPPSAFLSEIRNQKSESSRGAFRAPSNNCTFTTITHYELIFTA